MRRSLALLALLVSASPARAEPDSLAHVQLLGFNDFHGALTSDREVEERPAGGAAVLAAYLRDEIARFRGGTLIVHAGDLVGASPPASALLQDEPTIQVMNLLASPACTARARLAPRCNLVGTPGNHEFDEGSEELLRLVRGGPVARGPARAWPYHGARFPYVSANVVRARSGARMLPPYVIKQVDGVRVGVIGAVLEDTPAMVVARGIRGVRFLPEVEAIHEAVTELRARGVEALVVTIHQGGVQTPYEGPTQSDVPGPTGAIADIVAALDDAVDVVISGHAHAFTNALLKNRSGHAILVTQALSSGLAYADIELTIDRETGDVVSKSATIRTTYADEGPGLRPAADVAALVKRAEAAVGPTVQRVIGHASERLEARPNEAGESRLGNLIADAQRAAVGAQVALMNHGGIRTSVPAGDITWGELFAVQPFGNGLVSMDLTGRELSALLEQQWQSEPPRLFAVSGLAYVWDRTRPVGERVVEVRVGDAPLAPESSYRVVVNSFLEGGGGGFEIFRKGRRKEVGPVDLDALIAFIRAQAAPLTGALDGRIRVRP